jgi:hypothetical protein
LSGWDLSRAGKPEKMIEPMRRHCLGNDRRLSLLLLFVIGLCVAVCVVFVIECDGNEFLFVWGLGKGTSMTESERIGNKGGGPRARCQGPEARYQEQEARCQNHRPEARAGGQGHGGSELGPGAGGQGARTRGQRPETRVRGRQERE